MLEYPKPLRRPRRRRGMSREPSARQAAKDAEWSATRRAWLKRHPECQIPLKGLAPCAGRPEVHHVLLRSQGGKTDGSTPLMTLCSSHHEWAHLNKAEAEKIGARVGVSDREAR